MSLLASSVETSHELRGLASQNLGSEASVNAESERLLSRGRRISKAMNSVPPPSSSTVRTLGTFGGVICPVALSQFSTLLFLRLGFVVGQSGLILTITQFALAYMILFLTIFSICAISTNGAVEGGGVYFMISRTLGPQFGGAIGVLFFLANIFSCGLYVSGFVEGLLTNFGPGGRLADGALPAGSQLWHYLYALVVTIFCLLVCLIGGSMFAKTSLLILTVVFVVVISCIVTFLAQHPMMVPVPRDNHLVYGNNSNNPNFTAYDNFTGIKSSTFIHNLFHDWHKDYNTGNKMNFITVFAILFSSVTGIMNGANMSGELKRPSVSIPRGTIIGTVLTLLIYLMLSIFTAASCQRRLLIDNYGYLQSISLWKPFIFIGIVSTTLSAALGNLIGASRILYALAKDDLFGSFLKPAQWTAFGGNPIASVLISFFLVLCVNAIGKLNYIAPLVSVCFLLSYASVNLACALLDVASPPNFRPTFKAFHWQASILGLVGCVVMCFLINAIYASVALSIFLIMIAALHYRDFSMSWGSISQALLFHQVRKYLLLLDSRKDHVKYWRPQILLLVSNPKSSANLIHFVNDLKKGGLYVIGHVKAADFDRITFDPIPVETRNWLSMIDILHVKAFIEMTIAPSIRQGVHHLIRISGLGGMKPNTICLGFFDDAAPVDTLIRHRRLRNQMPTDYGTPSDNDVMSTTDTEEHPTANVSHPEPINQMAPSSTTSLLMESETDLRQSMRARQYNFLTQLEPLRGQNDPHSYELHEYVATLRDIIKMGKSVCLARHFQELDLTAMDDSSVISGWFRNRMGQSHSNSYIDVWPVNFFLPRTVSYLDTTCLFMLQLACILHMVPKWKSKTRIRVFLCVDAHTEDARTIRDKMNCLLNELRIAGETVMVPWDDLIIDLESSGWTPDPITASILGTSAAVPSTEGEQAYMSSYREGLPESYISSVNSLIRSKSANSAVCFCYLPRPPTEEAQWKAYHRDLTLLTDNLPPTILAHGLHIVTSTAL